jgi:hypothetical protein
MNMLKRFATVVPVIALLAMPLVGCSGGGGNNLSNNTFTTSASSDGGTPSVPQSTPVEAAGTTLVQVERLARPAINEGLLLTNDFLNAFNAIPPSQDAAALQGPVGAQVVAVLTAVGNTTTNINALVNALIPDVMRIDTTIPSTYAGGVTFTGAPFTSDIATIPSGGRLILDDVIDITLKLVLRNAAASDNINYDATPGNPGTGHQPLSTSFPYLAPPN